MVNNSGKELTNNFIKFSKLAESEGHKIIVVKETYENTKFTLDGYPFEFYKMMKNYKNFYRMCLTNIKMQKKVDELDI